MKNEHSPTLIYPLSDVDLLRKDLAEKNREMAYLQGKCFVANQMRNDLSPLLALLRAAGNNKAVDEFIGKYPL